MREKLIEKINELDKKSNLDFAVRNAVFRVVELIKQNEVEEKFEHDLLLELYRSLLFSNVRVSVDPRGSVDAKTRPIYQIEKAIKEKHLSENDLKYLKEVNGTCLSYYLDPLKMDKEKEEFYREYPGVIF